MKRIAFMALFAALAGALVLGAGACYNPKTPTPHPYETVGPAGPTVPYGLATPGVTIPSTWLGPSPTPYAKPPSGPAPGEPPTIYPTLGPGAPTPVPPVYYTLTPSYLKTPSAP